MTIYSEGINLYKYSDFFPLLQNVIALIGQARITRHLLKNYILRYTWLNIVKSTHNQLVILYDNDEKDNNKSKNPVTNLSLVCTVHCTQRTRNL